MLRAGQTIGEVESVPTEVVLQIFADRILVLITQLGKVGTLIQASLPANASFDDLIRDAADEQDEPAGGSTHPPLPPPPASISLMPVLGVAGDQPLLSLYTSQIATLVWAAESSEVGGGASRPVIVGLALKGGGSEDPKAFHGIMGLVREVLQSQ
ncbi:hypothetical protein PENSPDRAFT_681441 [Peniophora sp. CONT]|nr:hypothetical protein PENSPDRAFT_681441 [Peniophora sp. CONT]